jgi:hypothetical protein
VATTRVAAVASGRRDPAFAIFIAGIVLFLVAIAGGGNVVFGIADILIGVAIGMYARQGAPPAARSPNVYVLGLVIASVAAILDGVLTLADQTDVAGALTYVVLGGAAISLLGYSVLAPRR